MGCSKIDKLDKIVISFTLIIVTLSCIFNVFSNATEFVVPDGFYKMTQDRYIENAQIRDDGYISPVNFSSVYRIELLNGANYIYISSPYILRYVLSNDELSIGDTVDQLSYQEANSAVYLYNNGDFKYLYLSYFTDNTVNVYTNANGMTSAISDLSRIVDITSIWNIFEKAVPYILVVVLFSLGVWFIKHNIIEHSKGRDF